MKTLSLYDPIYPALKAAGMLFGSENPFDAFERLLGADAIMPANFRAPAIDVRETEDSYEIIAELPGLSDKDLKVELKEGVLSLSAERKEEKESKDAGTWVRKERREFAFSRSFVLPENADGDKVAARFKDGLLTVSLPKKPVTEPRLVPVNAA